MLAVIGVESYRDNSEQVIVRWQDERFSVNLAALCLAPPFIIFMFVAARSITDCRRSAAA
jgi:hypothetical protein